MRVHELQVEHFRGIEQLIWRPGPGLTCLVGPGDSTKTTVLDALSLLLSSGWNVQFDDSDFTGGDTTQDIVIVATLCDLSDDLINVEVFGSMLRGVDSAGTIHDDPMPGCDNAITLELRVDASLEPVWSTLKESAEEPKRLYSRSREALSAMRLDDGADKHLRWARGSALTRLTGPVPDVPLLLADSHRAARQAVFDNPDDQLSAAADSAQKAAVATAGVAVGELRPGLDPTLYSRLGSLVLHEGDLPIDTYGLGSRRLMGLALQMATGIGGTVLMVDEVEAGLEPHRLAHFVRQLVAAADAGDQVLLATHSPSVLEQLSVDQLAVTRSSAGTTTVRQVPVEMADLASGYQGLVRAAPSALLARRVVVGEGATEVGFAEGVLSVAELRAGRPLATEGVCVANGSDGRQAAVRSSLLAGLGYDVALIVDNDDRSADDAVATALGDGVEVVRWSSGNNIERQIAADISLTGLSALLDLAIEVRVDAGLEQEAARAGIRDAVNAQLTPDQALGGNDVQEWVSQSESETELRTAIGVAASKGWFKTQSAGYRLGEIVGSADLGESVLKVGIEAVVRFALPPDEP